MNCRRRRDECGVEEEKIYEMLKWYEHRGPPIRVPSEISSLRLLGIGQKQAEGLVLIAFAEKEMQRKLKAKVRALKV